MVIEDFLFMSDFNCTFSEEADIASFSLSVVSAESHTSTVSSEFFIKLLVMGIELSTITFSSESLLNCVELLTTRKDSGDAFVDCNLSLLNHILFHHRLP